MVGGYFSKKKMRQWTFMVERCVGIGFNTRWGGGGGGGMGLTQLEGRMKVHENKFLIE